LNKAENKVLKKILKILLIAVNILAVIAMLIPAFSQYLPPAKYAFAVYLGLFFLPIVLLNVFFVLFWLFKWKIYILISAISICVVYSDIKVSFSFFNRQKQETGKTIKVLTYNVMLFNYYDKKSKTLNYINNSGADIVCLQEFGWHKNGKDFLSKEKIISSLSNYPYCHINIALDNKKVTYGIATFSKYPIVRKHRIDYESYFNSSTYSDIKIDDDTVRIFNNHLESNRLTKNDKDRLSEEMDSEIISQTAHKLSVAAAIRAKQADSVAAEMARSPYKVIACGDFNDIPMSYVYQKISNDLQDTFVGSGKGIGITFSDKLYRFRIDYILANEHFKYYGYEIDKVKFSDHYPVFSRIKIDKD
jgi:endonuclease/exonuclease/phosphatase family metal-dependent hydrolase